MVQMTIPSTTHIPAGASEDRGISVVERRLNGAKISLVQSGSAFRPSVNCKMDLK